jgi:hypothetical protein
LLKPASAAKNPMTETESVDYACVALPLDGPGDGRVISIVPRVARPITAAAYATRRNGIAVFRARTGTRTTGGAFVSAILATAAGAAAPAERRNWSIPSSLTADRRGWRNAGIAASWSMICGSR